MSLISQSIYTLISDITTLAKGSVYAQIQLDGTTIIQVSPVDHTYLIIVSLDMDAIGKKKTTTM